MRILLAGDSLEVVTYEQFQLARKANISLEESACLPIFEFEAYVNMLIKDLRQEKQSIENIAASHT